MIALSVYPEVNRTQAPLRPSREFGCAKRSGRHHIREQKVDRRTAFDDCHRAFRT